jgi:hypothetical protein
MVDMLSFFFFTRSHRTWCVLGCQLVRWAGVGALSTRTTRGAPKRRRD